MRARVNVCVRCYTIKILIKENEEEGGEEESYRGGQ